MPVFYENDQFMVRAFGAPEVERLDELSQDILEILSDERTLKFIPEKRLRNLTEAKTRLKGMLLDHHTARNQIYFIIEKNAKKVIGILELMSPELVKHHYQLREYPHFVEFYLSSHVTGCSIMSSILPIITDILLSKGIPKIAAVVNRNNIPARKVLLNASFVYRSAFDPTQDLFETASTQRAV